MAMATAAAEPATAAAGPVGAALRAAVDLLQTSGSPSPRLDAELLVAHALGRERSWVIAHPEATFGDTAAARLGEWVARRAAGEPVAYIRGYKEWLSLRIGVDRRVLIPRPETEVLAEAAIAELRGRIARAGGGRPVVGRDVGTGSGALAVAIGVALRGALHEGTLCLEASDSSPAALEVAAANLAGHGLERLVRVIEADLVEDVDAWRQLDVMVANLPYVPSDEVDRLPVAASFEPREALAGGADGLDVIRALVERVPNAVAGGGVALLEIGAGQASAVRGLAQRVGVRAAGSFYDLAGVERVVRLERG
ncbi:MAG: peptide chain release factor N(5)-glutamine methyltransferase [Candidatus Limnocylindria bacterium]